MPPLVVAKLVVRETSPGASCAAAYTLQRAGGDRPGKVRAIGSCDAVEKVRAASRVVRGRATCREILGKHNLSRNGI